jgi:hypothetical protein
MSRTYKDKPSKFKYEPWDKDRISFSYIEDGYFYYGSMYGKTTKTKKRKEVDTEWHWMGSGPSWFKRMFMNVPQRRAGRIWERKVLFEDIEETDAPGVSHKPHIYWW